MNISPHKLIQEPQMRSCSSHLSSKNVLSSFRNESIIIIIIIIMHISPRKLIQEPQMRSCSSHLSNKNEGESKLNDGSFKCAHSTGPRTVVPNLWPAGQKWPARPQKVALDLLKNFKNICATTAKFLF